MNLEINDAVLADDLPSIYAYIARENPSAAERVLAAIDSAFKLIVQTPSCGVAYASRNPHLKGARMLPVSGFSDYLIFYRIENDTVRVLYVVH